MKDHELPKAHRAACTRRSKGLYIQSAENATFFPVRKCRVFGALSVRALTETNLGKKRQLEDATIIIPSKWPHRVIIKDVCTETQFIEFKERY